MITIQQLDYMMVPDNTGLQRLTGNVKASVIPEDSAETAKL